MNITDIEKRFEDENLFCGRMISASKRNVNDHFCVWNANVIIKSQGKIWFGDLDITKEADALRSIAKEIGEEIFVLRESDCRFNTENDPVDVLIRKAVWSTSS